MLTTVWATQLRFSGRIPFVSKHPYWIWGPQGGMTAEVWNWFTTTI